ncbi:MAG: BACON domain-containing protein, partial [Alistipes sp.]|nr:BACON domain-containing protein [Alistipes sp.]
NELTGPDAPESNVISTIANLTAGQYYMAAYLVSYSDNDWTATPYHLWNGTVNSGDLVTVDYSFNDNVLATSSSDSAAVVTLEAVDGKANTYYVKCGGKYLYSTASATNRSLALSTNPVEWVATDNANGGITLSSNGVYLGTATAGSKLLRSYDAEDKLQAGVYFFAVDDVVLVLPPSITADNIRGVAVEGVTDATATFTSENLTEAITVTCDGIVVTAASVAESTITYTVSENTTELTREGWIKLAANGVEKTITVSQLAPISEPEGVTTVTLETFSAASADMDGVISYACSKGGGTADPFISGDYEIRLYQNSSGTGGGYITITAKTGYTISSVTIGSSTATSVAHTIGASNVKSATSSLAANAKHTVSDVNSSSISIYCMGITKNTRLNINYLSVSYKAAN